ncbi:MAG: hypothetical protein H0Z34_09365 [Brevibacillus sp.]|nr:hypothetical protein [Brevibacillus sp.]
MNYVPVLRYRQEEKMALMSVRLSRKIMPLIEIVKEKPRANQKENFQDLYRLEFSKIEIPFMVDFPMYLEIKYTNSQTRNFLGQIYTNPAKRIEYFYQLVGNPNLIPVVSYNPDFPYDLGALIKSEASNLRKKFNRLAFRVFFNGFNEAIDEIKNLIHQKDILIFDLDTAPHNNNIFSKHYATINQLRKKFNLVTVIVRSALNMDITNVGLVNGQPVTQADNSLLIKYRDYDFDAFGDFAGIKKDLLSEGGTISPGVIYYSGERNCYYGFNSKLKTLESFETVILPSILNSEVWKRLSDEHKKNCPGCRAIENIAQGKESGKHQGKWKRISMMHYLYSMEEFL